MRISVFQFDIDASAKCIRLIPYVILLQARVIHAIFVCIWSGFSFRRYLSAAYRPRGKFALLLLLLFYLFIYFSAYSRSLLTLKAETLFSLFILCLLCSFREGAITLTGMLGPLWRCAALSGCDIASVLMWC